MPLWSEVNPTDIKLNGWKGRMMCLDGPIRFQIPEARVPFGVSVFNSKKDIQLEMIDPEWKSWISTLEAHVCQLLSDDAMNVFSTEKSASEVMDLWKSNYRDDKLRVKLDDCSFWDSDNQPLDPPENIERWLARSRASALVEVRNIYFFNGTVGLVWKAKQVKILENNAPKLAWAGTQDSQIPKGTCLL